MKAWTALLLLTAALAYVPAADAHACNGGGCGPCPQGEDHAHNGLDGQCASSAYGSAENGPEGQRASPGSGTFWTLVALVGAAGMLVLARRG